MFESKLSKKKTIGQLRRQYSVTTVSGRANACQTSIHLTSLCEFSRAMCEPG